MKKTTLLAGVATGALAIAAPANAADLRMPVKAAPIAAPAPYFSWTGCYVGAHVGWGWGKKDFDVAVDTGDGLQSAPSFNGGINTSGALFGGQLGCNYQFQNTWVLGIEGSVSGADINGFDANTCRAGMLQAKTDFLASVTGRIGWSGWDPRVLFYFKGGAAWAHDRYNDQRLGTSGHNFINDETRTGWTVGAGFEWAFAPNWSAFAEYDFYDFGRKDVLLIDRSDPGSTILHANIKQTINTVRVGVNYRFNWFLGKGKAPVVAGY
jgi:outer membrane immunogenic protein